MANDLQQSYERAAKNVLPPLAELQRCFRYAPADGKLFWRFRSEVAAHVNARLVDREAGSLNQHGYRQIELAGRTYVAHRIIFKLLHGRDPVGDVDHRDGDTSNNRSDNLRECSHQQNGWNAKRRKGSRWPKGVTFHKRDRKFYAQIALPTGRRHLGSFDDAMSAGAAYRRAASAYFDTFARFE